VPSKRISRQASSTYFKVEVARLNTACSFAYPNCYKYNEGSTYADFVPGTDTVAAVGAGALAYKLITGKTAAKVSVELLALLAIFAKKLWFLVFVPLFSFGNG